MPAKVETIDHGTFERLVHSGAVQGVTVTGQSAGWHISARRKGAAPCMLEARRGHLRAFRTLETALRYLAGLGIEHFDVDASGFDPEAFRKVRQRPDAAAAMREKHDAAEHARWFQQQVELGLADTRSSPLAEVMDRLEARARELSRKAKPDAR